MLLLKTWICFNLQRQKYFSFPKDWYFKFSFLVSRTFTHPLIWAHSRLSVEIIDMLTLSPVILVVSWCGKYLWREGWRFFNLQNNEIHYYHCNIWPTSINSKERKLKGKETRNLSKIWPLDLDFPADFLKYWKIQVNVFFKLKTFTKLRMTKCDQIQSVKSICGGFLSYSGKCSVG